MVTLANLLPSAEQALGGSSGRVVPVVPAALTQSGATLPLPLSWARQNHCYHWVLLGSRTKCTCASELWLHIASWKIPPRPWSCRTHCTFCPLAIPSLLERQSHFWPWWTTLSFEDSRDDALGLRLRPPAAGRFSGRFGAGVVNAV